MSTLIIKLRALGFHVNEHETKATVYKHGDYILSLTRYTKNDNWKFSGCHTPEQRVITIAKRIAYNWKVRRIYLWNK